MRFIPVCLIALCFVAPAWADDKPKPNALTPKEIADGWIMLFDGETTFGWKIDGASEVKDGVLILGKGKKTVAYPTTNFDYFEIVIEWKGNGNCFHQYQEVSLNYPDGLDAKMPWLEMKCFRKLIDGKRAEGISVTGGGSSIKSL
ncbi:MAG TPA: family 16 glycoside hydrolase, partial [Urbifossiella sp.]